MMSDDLISSWCDTLEHALSNGDLPGTQAQQAMIPVPRRLAPLGQMHPVRKGGVLILLYPGAEGMSFPVTLRSQRVLHHKGQISLPGGLQEVEDASLADTALRETQEEIGVGPSHVRLLGKLTPIYVTSSNSNVYPYVGFCATVPDFSLNPDEVIEVIEMSLNTLLDPTHREEEYRQINDRRVRVPFFWLGEHKIWGATAMILEEFATILSATPELARTPNHPAC